MSQDVSSYFNRFSLRAGPLSSDASAETDAPTSPLQEFSSPLEEHSALKVPTSPVNEFSSPAEEPSSAVDAPTSPVDEPGRPADAPSSPAFVTASDQSASAKRPVSRRRHDRLDPRARFGQIIQEHGRRVTSFSAIGLGVFLGGLGLQALLVQVFAFSAVTSFLTQGIISVEVSFILNRRFTWPDRKVSFWRACWRYNAQKVALAVVQLMVYIALVRFGLNYLLANVTLTGVFTVINYVGGDFWSFALTRQAAVSAIVTDGAEWPLSQLDYLPTVSIVVPCKNNQRTIRATAESLLNQNYPALVEVILVGSSGDCTWSALNDILDPRLIIIEQESTPGKRDPNAKRDKGIQHASGQLLALADSDIVMDPNWLSAAVWLMQTEKVDYVAGGMRSIHDSFWGRFVDNNRLAAKTPRVKSPYMVTRGNFGKRGRKPPVTANALFTRDLYREVPLDVGWTYGYEDYEWLWRVVKDKRFRVLYTNLHPGWHHHRRRLGDLLTEYRRSAEGCAHFVRVHPDSPLARKRRRQAFILPGLAGPALAAGVWAVASGRSMILLIAAGVLVAGLMGWEAISARRLEAAAYPYAGVTLGVVYTWSLTRNLVRKREAAPVPPVWASTPEARPRHARRLPRLSWPLTAILALQTALSLSLVFSNTAFGDEADYLLQGRLEWAHWLHGAPLPQFNDSGASQIYPAIGALANAVGGLAAARILSLCFMLTATVLLYLSTVRLFDRVAAVVGCALWAVSEPVLRLAFATFDPLACLLMILAFWLAIQAGVRRRRGELITLSALSLALATVTAISFAIMIPVIAVVAFCALWSMIGARAAAWCAGWLTGASLTATGILMTVLHLWRDAVGSTVGRPSASLGQGVSLVLQSAWAWDGLLFVIAAAGTVAAFMTERDWSRKLLLAALSLAGLAVPVSQAYIGTGFSMDKHMTVGTALTAAAAGYAISRLTAPLAARRAAVAACGAALLVYPAVTGLSYARSTFHHWANTTSLVSAVHAATAGDHAPILVESRSGNFEIQIMEYYLMSGTDWQRWRQYSPADLTTVQHTGYSAIAIELDAASLDLPQLAASALQGAKAEQLRAKILTLAGDVKLVNVISANHRYKLYAVIPYQTQNFTNRSGVFVVWKRTAPAVAEHSRFSHQAHSTVHA